MAMKPVVERRMRPVCIVLPHADAGHDIRRLREVQGAKTQTKIVILGDAGPELALVSCKF